MIFDVLTLFPEMFGPVQESIIGRAANKGIITINTVNIRDFACNSYGKIDDYPYGGGPGLIIMAPPVYNAYLSLIKKYDKKPPVIYMTPQGKPLNQETVKRLAVLDHMIILCGHYEGIDERVIEEIVDEEISIGDFVVTGGELPAMLLIDAVSRLQPGVLSGEDSFTMESHFNGLLEYPQYTRPPVFLSREVPEILLSGHHRKISEWRQEQALERTRTKRPDLYNARPK